MQGNEDKLENCCIEAREVAGKEVDCDNKCPFPKCIKFYPPAIRAEITSRAKAGIKLTKEMLDRTWGPKEGRSSFNVYNEFLEEGTVAGTAKNLGIDGKTAGKKLNDWLVYPLRDPDLLKWKYSEVIHMYTSGCRIEEITGRFGISRRHVYRIIKAKMTPNRKRGRPKKNVT